jgi:hypothetical protein
MEWSRRIEVDGIVSRTDITECVAIEPMFRIIEIEHEYGASAYLRCSQPYTTDDEKRWLRGEELDDLDSAQCWA